MDHQHHQHQEIEGRANHKTKELKAQAMHTHHHPDFGRKFWVSLILTLPVLYYAELIQDFLHYTAVSFPGSAFVSPVLGTVVFFYGGWVFLTGAVTELKDKAAGMMTLISLAIVVAYTYSLAAIFFNIGDPLWWELTTLVTIMLLGHWMEMRSVQGAETALKELSKLIPDTAERITPAGETETVKTEELRTGDIFLVRPGSGVPTDGIVIEGKSEVNESMISGESRPVKKERDSEVVAGTINGNGSLRVKVTKTGENTFLSGMMRLIQEAQTSKSKTQILSDRAAFYLTIIAISAGIATFSVWILLGQDFAFAIKRTVTVLVIACPHALGLAIPLVAAISTALAARSGFLVRKRLALESAHNIDTVLFDKTGTLTKGEMGVTDIIESGSKNRELGEAAVLKIAATLEQNSEHSLAKAVVGKAKENKIILEKVLDFKAIPGFGVEGVIDGNKYYLGNHQLINNVFQSKSHPEQSEGSRPAESNQNASLDSSLSLKMTEQVEALEKQGKSVVILASGKEIIGLLAIADVIKPESKEAIADLGKMGVDVAMITGDAEEVAKHVAKELGIDKYFARVLPEEKSSKVKELQKSGKKVAMVGDGINDAPALIQADLGVAIGAGTNVAIESAGIILVKNDPRDIVKIINLSKATYSKMVQNLFWATGYNVVAIPLAAGVLAAQGILLQPAVGAVFMSLSTIIVAFNALLLWRKKI